MERPSGESVGRIVRINGPMITVTGLRAKIGDVILLGEWRLMSEVVRIIGDKILCQCYEDPSGLKPGDVAVNTHKPLVAELGPGLIGHIFDGLQFDEVLMWQQYGPFWQRGVKVDRLDRKKRWEFVPKVKRGDKISAGDIIGVVQETRAVEHRIMVPPDVKGELEVVEVNEGKFTVLEPVVIARTKSGEEVKLRMMQEWPVRIPRPYKERLPPVRPLITGQRVIDTFFPIVKGGTAAIPGGFGTGKTVTLQQLAKWSDADICIYVGCGERGNEMAEQLHDWRHLEDPRTGLKLVERSIAIANVSNLPVYAREASIYMGVTIGEYFRDMGYDVALQADSTSRWAEALRDIAGRLEELPAEGGFPAYLADRIAKFYERAGRVVCLGRPERVGSLTIMGAVSPPGGDFSEPVTSITFRFVGTMWALDKELAFRRHFPAINWLLSFSRYVDTVRDFWEKLDPEWYHLREEAMRILEESSKIEHIARVIGERALPEDQRLILFAAELIKEGFLVQNAFHDVDRYTPPEKQVKMLRTIIEFYRGAYVLVRHGVPVEKIRSLPVVPKILKMKFEPRVEVIDAIRKEAHEQLKKLAEEYGIKLAA